MKRLAASTRGEAANGLDQSLTGLKALADNRPDAARQTPPPPETELEDTLMTIARRAVMGAGAFAACGLSRPAFAAAKLKISHQFPGGTIDKGDFRDRLCRVFAAEVAKRSNGELDFDITPIRA